MSLMVIKNLNIKFHGFQVLLKEESYKLTTPYNNKTYAILISFTNQLFDGKCTLCMYKIQISSALLLCFRQH